MKLPFCSVIRTKFPFESGLPALFSCSALP